MGYTMEKDSFNSFFGVAKIVILSNLTNKKLFILNLIHDYLNNEIKKASNPWKPLCH